MLAPPRRIGLTHAMRASAVVVTHQSAGHIGACLEALQADGAGELEIIVVDNRSTDGTAEQVRAQFPAVTLHVTHRNIGYGAAANIGIGLATGDPILVLNADAIIERGTIAAVRARLEADPSFGCVSPVHLDADGSSRSPARAFPSIGAALADGTMLERWLRGSAVLRSYYRDAAVPDAPPDWLDGACLAFRARALRDVGGFDAGYFMYSEELDLHRALRAAGWTCAVEDAAQVRHVGSASAGRDLVARERNFFRSRYRFAGKMWGRPFAVFLRLFVALVNLVRLAEQLLRLLLGRGAPSPRAEAGRIARVTLWQWFGWRR
ncbi:MAG: glycosyltransferase family 2 protein [Chloroflexi bacterium]|nr:glycosyltransferase family 2 protein [Chloroflexota bacterium]